MASEDLALALQKLHDAAMEQTIHTGPEPVYEPTEAAEQAYHDWKALAWQNAGEIIAALAERDRLVAVVEAAARWYLNDTGRQVVGGYDHRGNPVIVENPYRVALGAALDALNAKGGE